MTTDRFKNRKAALLWLQEKGQISTGSFYGHCERGFVEIAGRRYPLDVAPDKTLSKFQVAEFAAAYFQRSAPAVAVVDYTESRAKAELDIALANARIARVKADNAERELDDRWIYREDADDRLAATIGQLGNLLHRHLLQAVPALIHLCGGDPARGAELYDGAEEIIIKSFNDLYHAGRVDGVFTAEDADAV